MAFDLPHDKALHVIIGALLACLGALVDPLVGATLCATAAVAKELRDLTTGKGTPDWLDLLATFAGGAIVLIPLVIPKVV